MKSDINAAKSYDGITDYDISTLIENIQRIMKERNITQEELAAAAGIAQPRISKIFKREGSNCFTIQQLVAIASYFHVSVDSLLGIKTNNPPEEEKRRPSNRMDSRTNSEAQGKERRKTEQRSY